MEDNYTYISDEIKNTLKRDSEIYLNLFNELKKCKDIYEKYLL
ncbi:hypothetical protein JCM11957_04180 [Caminibacter profundus]